MTARIRQGCKVGLAPVRQRSLDALMRRRGPTGAALEIGVSQALVESLAYGGRARAESVRVVSDAIGVAGRGTIRGRTGSMSDDELRFEVLGPPVPCARARVVRNGRTGKVHGVTPARTRAYEEHVRWAAIAAVGRARWKFTREDRYEIELTFHLANDRGDWDNLAKAATDPLKGVVWHDDAHVKASHVKVLVNRERPRAEIVIRKIPWTAPPPVRAQRDARSSGAVPIRA